MTVAAEITPDLKQPTLWRTYAEIIVRWIIALVLLTAAAMKADQIATEPMHGSGWQASRPLAILLVEFQAFLGFWLMSGLLVRLSHQIALLTFIAFFGFACYETWLGAPSCNCFGKAFISPTLTAGLDALIVGGLFATASAVAKTPPRLWGRVAFFSTGLLLALAAIPTMLGFRPLALFRGPDLLLDNDWYSFGIIDPVQAQKLDHEFRIENHSAQPVRLVKSSSTCSCTVAQLPKDPIPPGGYTLVRVVAHWPGRFGPQKEEVLLGTDSPTQASVAVRITGNIVAPAVHWPDIVKFGEVIEGQSISKTITLAPGAGQKSFQVLSADTDDQLLTLHKVVQNRDSEAEQIWKISLTARSAKDETRSLARFIVDLQGQNEIRIPVLYTIRPAIRPTPQSLLFWSKRPNARSIAIDSPEPLGELKIVSSDLDSGLFDIRTDASTQTPSGWHSNIEIKLLAAVDHLSNATLTISTGSFLGHVSIVIMP